jgi:dethiobiotin synthetase
MAGALSLAEINSWHFRAPIAPVLAAQREKKQVRLAPLLAHIRVVQKKFDVVLIEGAGGLLSPLGADFNSRDVISALRATPVIVAANRLGAVNHILLTLEALPENVRAVAWVVLMTPAKPDAATVSNASLLEQSSVHNVCRLPWLGKNFSAGLADALVRRTLAAITEHCAIVPANHGLWHS